VKEVSGELLAVLREVLSNVARHAGASQVEVSVSTEDGELCLLVLDNGVGPPHGGSAGDGITKMKARATRLGGTASVSARPEGGTRVEWRVHDGPGLPSGEAAPEGT
jgi:signal transduction histidine kinase